MNKVLKIFLIVAAVLAAIVLTAPITIPLLIAATGGYLH